MHNAEPDAQYWYTLVEDSKLPMGLILLCDSCSGALQHV